MCVGVCVYMVCVCVWVFDLFLEVPLEVCVSSQSVSAPGPAPGPSLVGSGRWGFLGPPDPQAHPHFVSEVLGVPYACVCLFGS